VVTRKRADRQTALAVLDAVRLRAPGACVGLARLEIGGFRPLRSGEPVPPSRLQGARVALAAGVADPESVAAQIERLGAEVRVLALPDHHSYDARDVTRLLHVQETVDYVVVTEKDAVKLDALWPADAKEPLVASLEVTWEDGYLDVERVLNAGRSSAS
jgi:tetraacyldisaccharide-1-P 4'-kinase